MGFVHILNNFFHVPNIIHVQIPFLHVKKYFERGHVHNHIVCVHIQKVCVCVPNVLYE